MQITLPEALEHELVSGQFPFLTEHGSIQVIEPVSIEQVNPVLHSPLLTVQGFVHLTAPDALEQV